MADEVGLRRFERGAAGVENNVECGIDTGEAHADHFADPAADAVTVVRFADSARDSKADAGSRCARPWFTGIGH